MELVPSAPAPPGMAGSAIPGEATRYDDYGSIGGGFASAPPSLNVSMRLRPFKDGNNLSIKAGDILFIQKLNAVDHNPECVPLCTLEDVNANLPTFVKDLPNATTTEEFGGNKQKILQHVKDMFQFVGFAAADVDSGGPEDQSLAVTIEGMAQMRSIAVSHTAGTGQNRPTTNKVPLYPGQAVSILLDVWTDNGQTTGKLQARLFVVTEPAKGDNFHIGTVMQGCASGSLSAEERGVAVQSKVPHARLAPKAMLCCSANNTWKV